MKKFGESMKEFWKRLWHTQNESQSNPPSHERDYLKEIEQRIEDFCFMNVEKQTEIFSNLSLSIRNDLAEGGLDSKVHIKYLMRLAKIIKIATFFRSSDIIKHIEQDPLYLPLLMCMQRFINELHGIEKIKEDDFLNVLNHEDKVSLNNTLMGSMGFFRVTMDRSSYGTFNYPQPNNFYTDAIEHFVRAENSIKEIIGKALQKITEQEKVNKLKIASEVFKKKAREYRKNAKRFLMSAAMLIMGVFVFIFLKALLGYKIFEYNIISPQKSDIDNNAFYIYFILEILFSGRLLFSIIALTGFLYCLRFYAASQHNAIICDQRANTLESFEALYENVEEDKERLLVVEKVLNSATEHLPTGFSKQQSDSGVGGIDLSKLLSLVKGK